MKTTFPQLLLKHAAERPTDAALREKEYGIWQTWTWKDTAETVRHLACGLLALGFQRGQNLALVGDNRPHLYMSMVAVQSIGGVPIPLYQDAVASEMAFVMEDAEVQFLFAENQEQVDKLLEVRETVPGMAHIIYDDPRGLRKYDQPGLISTEKLKELGAEWDRTHAGAWDAQVAQNRPDDVSVILYTSGTTGKPKGVMLTHRNVVSDVQAVLERIAPTQDDVFLSFLPLSHTFERTGGYYLPVAAGCCVAFARSVALLADDLKTIRPTVLVSVPRIYERVHAKLLEMLSPTPWKMQLYEAAQSKGWQRFCRAQGLPLPAHDEALGGWMNLLPWPVLQALVAQPLLAQFGGRVRVAVSGGAPLSPTIAKCFLGLGLPLVQGYGMTETSPVVCVNTVHDNDPASVGRALPGVEVRIGENRELQVRGPIVMKGYWKRPEDTAKTLDAEGWLGTGDQADIVDGRIYIRGRIKEIIVTSTGEKIPPGDLELALQSDPLLEQTFVVGENRPFIACVAVLKRDEWLRLAEGLGLEAQDPGSLNNPAVHRAILARIETSTASFPRYAVPRTVYCTLEPWTTENGFMTPTLKLKRNNLMAYFAQAIEGMYQKPGGR